MRALMAAVTVMVALAMAAASARASDPDTAGMKRAFDALEKALRDGDEPAFERGWFPEGYRQNLVGGSGLPGRRVFKQGHRKGWVLRPDLSRLEGTGRGAPWIVPCDVWSHVKNRSVDHVDAALIWHDGRWVILGAGEKRAQVLALARRYLEKKPLAPPAEPAGPPAGAPAP
jgi:hypothetical protein